MVVVGRLLRGPNVDSHVRVLTHGKVWVAMAMFSPKNDPAENRQDKIASMMTS